MPSAPVYEQPNRLSAARKFCSVCKNPIHTRYADLACKNVCHLAATCSGFVNHGGTARAHALSTRVWHCHLHSSPSATLHPSLSPATSPPHPTPPWLKSLLNQGLSLADANSSKEKCAKCSAALRSNTVPARCSVCSKEFHQKCSTEPKASTRDSYWKCDNCTNNQRNRTSQTKNRQLPVTTNSSSSQHVPTISQNKLKIYQWNADGICPKSIELRDRLLNSDINVLAVQKSKLRKTDKTPSIEGYATIRKDRNNTLEGGLLLFIWTDIVFKKLHSFEKAGMEILSIHIKATKWIWLDFYNVYLPNISTQHNSFDPYLIKLGPSSLILLNGHSQMWDSLQPQDQRGDKILDRILDNDLHILNDSSATRTGRIAGNDSTPNISICGSNWSAKTSWRIAEPIGNSDHPPIIIELNHKICYKPVIPRSAWWRRNGIDWSSFTNEVESKMGNLPNEPNLSLRVSRLDEILISVASTHVGKSKTSKRSKPWMTHMCEPKFATEIAFVRRSIKTKEAMSHSGRAITDIKSKANVFINHYTRVSKINMWQSDRDTTNSSRNVLNYHLLTMRAVLHF